MKALPRAVCIRSWLQVRNSNHHVTAFGMSPVAEDQIHCPGYDVTSTSLHATDVFVPRCPPMTSDEDNEHSQDCR